MPPRRKSAKGAPAVVGPTGGVAGGVAGAVAGDGARTEL
jgi:hypothetical protein